MFGQIKVEQNGLLSQENHSLWYHLYLMQHEDDLEDAVSLTFNAYQAWLSDEVRNLMVLIKTCSPLLKTQNIRLQTARHNNNGDDSDTKHKDSFWK